MVKAIEFAVRDFAGRTIYGSVAGEGGTNVLSVGAREAVSLNLSSFNVLGYERSGQDLLIQLTDGRTIILIPSGAKADSGGDSQRAESLNLWRQVLGGHGHGYSDRIAGGF
jgi:hypothetical protein